MNDNTRQLAEKVARGKGLNADDRTLLAKISVDQKELKAYADHMISCGKKAEKIMIEYVKGEGNFKGFYFKMQINWLFGK